jgi:hypothetical protein
MLSHLFSKLPVSRPADWGCKVSICIAALCEKRKVVVVASDMLATLGSTASDVSVMKNDVLFPRWVVLTAGDDTEHIDPILNRAKQLLRRKLERKTPQEVASKLTQAYQERLQEEIAAKVLSRYRFTPNTFRDTGKKRLTASVYNALAARIAAIKLRLHFLVAGFDHGGIGHVLGLMGEECPVSYDKLGYWAIGEGAPMALASLGFFNHEPKLSGTLSVGDCVYQVLAAKFMAEATKTVGRQSFFAVYGPNDGQVRFISLADQQRVREAWETEGAPRIPKQIVEKIPNMLYSFDGPPESDPKRVAETNEWAAMVAAKPWIARR